MSYEDTSRKHEKLTKKLVGDSCQTYVGSNAYGCQASGKLARAPALATPGAAPPLTLAPILTLAFYPDAHISQSICVPSLMKAVTRHKLLLCMLVPEEIQSFGNKLVCTFCSLHPKFVLALPVPGMVNLPSQFGLLFHKGRL